MKFCAKVLDATINLYKDLQINNLSTDINYTKETKNDFQIKIFINQGF